MSTRRASEGGWAGALPKGPNGRSLCRRCNAEVPKGRQTFCSKGCVHEWRIRTDPGYLRQETFKRDRGVCAVCGIDTMGDREDRRKRSRGTGHLWQADHIKPVVEGGGECALDNIRTLCTPCHRETTKALAARRAEERKAAKHPRLFTEVLA
jgi:5-methylcytosine-specific restriction protein A